MTVAALKKGDTLGQVRHALVSRILAGTDGFLRGTFWTMITFDPTSVPDPVLTFVLPS